MKSQVNASVLGDTIIDNFKRLNTVPRGSYHEEAVSSLLLSWGGELGLKCSRDQANNVVMVKDAQGTQDMRPVILQAHMDMVCAVVDAHKDYDFLNNPIYPKEETSPGGERILTGRGTRPAGPGKWEPVEEIRTTLGADDGIGVASILAILGNREIIHPPIIAIFTTGEEVGMIGAKKVDRAWVQKTAGELDLSQARLINVDEEQDGRFCYGCAGGAGVDLTAECKTEAGYDPTGYQAFTLTVSGLLGGHSGIEIGQRHANAIRLVGRLLHAFLEEPFVDFKLFGISGGSAENAIASFASCDLAVRGDETQALHQAFDRAREALIKEYREVEKTMELTLKPAESPDRPPISRENRDYIVNLLYLLPNDVLGFLDCDGYSVVETSANMGVISTDGASLRLQGSVRSFYDARRDFVVGQMEQMAKLFGFGYYTHDEYTGWAQSPDSRLRVVFTEAYHSLFPEDPVGGRSIHAGLECGVFAEVFGDIDMIACGPTIRDVHTPKEALYLDTVPKIGLLLVEVLERLAE